MKLTEPSGCVTPPTFPMPPIYGAGIVRLVYRLRPVGE